MLQTKSSAELLESGHGGMRVKGLEATPLGLGVEGHALCKVPDDCILVLDALHGTVQYSFELQNHA